MSRIIRITEDIITQIRNEFETTLSSCRLTDGRVSFTKTFSSIKRNATLYFTEKSWLKMQALVREFDKEVAWHGTARRIDSDDKDEYIIDDILVYPQEVTGATVTTDQTKYQNWLMSREDDVFNNLRMQGHSHVNMGTSPSGVDDSLYERLLNQLDDDMFYIFMIWNKRGEKTIKIYDLEKNVLFETADVSVQIIEDGTGVERLIKEAKTLVTSKPATVYSGYKTTNYSEYYNQYYGNNHAMPQGSVVKTTKATTPVQTKDVNKIAGAQKFPDPVIPTPKSQKTGLRKGKKFGSKKNGAANNKKTYHDYTGYEWED